MKNSKTHYRKVFKSDHLGVADLEEMIEDGVKLVFTIKEVKAEFGVSVAGRKGNHNIAYFKEDIKPLVLNAGNNLIVKRFNDSKFVDDWKNIRVTLYVNMSVKNPSTGEPGGVGVREVQPKQPAKKTPFTEDHFEKAKEAGAGIEQIKKKYTITEEIKDKYLEYVTT